MSTPVHYDQIDAANNFLAQAILAASNAAQAANGKAYSRERTLAEISSHLECAKSHYQHAFPETLVSGD